MYTSPSVLNVNSSHQDFLIRLHLARTPTSPVVVYIEIPRGWDGAPLMNLSSDSWEFVPPPDLNDSALPSFTPSGSLPTPSPKDSGSHPGIEDEVIDHWSVAEIEAITSKTSVGGYFLHLKLSTAATPVHCHVLLLHAGVKILFSMAHCMATNRKVLKREQQDESIHDRTRGLPMGRDPQQREGLPCMVYEFTHRGQETKYISFDTCGSELDTSLALLWKDDNGAVDFAYNDDSTSCGSDSRCEPFTGCAFSVIKSHWLQKSWTMC
eukprot:1145072-Pelagomonas_calceolata.AAC.3